MILVTVIVTSVFQILFYIVLDRLKFEKIKPLILVAVLCIYWFLFPRFFIPELPPGPKCGMGVFAIYLGFLGVATLASLAMHFMYTIIIRLVK